LRSKLAKELLENDLIIWDEAPMMHKHCFEAVCKTLQDICKNDLLFGGKTLHLTGEFRNRGQIIAASIKCSNFWHHVQHMKLQQNMRVNVEEREFA
jgi:ATP-dependent DNA helicase PIF1